MCYISTLPLCEDSAAHRRVTHTETVDAPDTVASRHGHRVCLTHQRAQLSSKRGSTLSEDTAACGSPKTVSRKELRKPVDVAKAAL